MKIAIIDYGAGNIRSVQFALNRLGFEGTLTHNEREILTADRVVFPGIGEAKYAMNQLQKTGIHELIPALKQPVLGICLGMQLMCDYTEEGNTKGLGIFDVQVQKFSAKVKVPHMGWNTIYDLKSSLFEGIEPKEYMYLVHSYFASINHQTIAKSCYQEEFSTALNKDNFFGVQFHPEKSGVVGEKLLYNFLTDNILTQI
jgi:imidazole glycerol-phosphate synthase subunit HisH